MEKVLYCFYKIILKNMRKSKTSQPCLLIAVAVLSCGTVYDAIQGGSNFC